MGEHKNPTERLVAITREEMVDLLSYLVTPATSPQGPYLRGTKTRADRKSLRDALVGLGVWEVYQVARRGGSTFAEVAERLYPEPERAVRITTASLGYLLEQVLTDMPHGTGMSLLDLEERLENAKAGLYRLPSDLAASVPEKWRDLLPAAE
jgi:hypothetical protein